MAEKTHPNNTPTCLQTVPSPLPQKRQSRGSKKEQGTSSQRLWPRVRLSIEWAEGEASFSLRIRLPLTSGSPQWMEKDLSCL